MDNKGIIDRLWKSSKCSLNDSSHLRWRASYCHQRETQDESSHVISRMCGVCPNHVWNLGGSPKKITFKRVVHLYHSGARKVNQLISGLKRILIISRPGCTDMCKMGEKTFVSFPLRGWTSDGKLEGTGPCSAGIGNAFAQVD